MKVEEFSGPPAEWTEFLETNQGGILQTAEWAAFRLSLGWQARQLAVRDGDDLRLTAMVLQKPLPGGYCFFYCPEGPIVKDGDWQETTNQAAFTLLQEWLAAAAKRERALFFKIDPHLPLERFPVDWLTTQGFRDSPEDIQAAVVAEVDLQPPEAEILAKMKQKGRYNIRYAERKGVSARLGATDADLDAFYALHESTAKRQGFTFRTKEYFATFQKHFMVDANHAAFGVAEHDGQPVAAILVTFLGDEAIYLYGGSAPQDRNVYASYLVQWQAMQEAKRRGCKFYNMTGVSAKDDPQDPWHGLRQFKLKFGAEVVSLVGARDFVYKKTPYFLFTNADRVRRRIAKRAGL